MTTNTIDKVDWSRMSAAAKARKLGYHPTRAVRLGAIDASGAADYADLPRPQPAETTNAWTRRVIAAVAEIGGVPEADISTPAGHAKRDPKTALARCAAVKALRRHLSRHAVCHALAMNETPASRLNERTDEQAEIMAQRARTGRGVRPMPHDMLHLATRRPHATVRAILDAVSDVSGVSHRELMSPRRAPSVARPRMLAMWLARERTGQSLPQIGRAVGDRDHTTVLRAWRRWPECRQYSAELRALERDVVARLERQGKAI